LALDRDELALEGRARLCGGDFIHVFLLPRSLEEDSNENERLSWSNEFSCTKPAAVGDDGGLVSMPIAERLFTARSLRLILSSSRRSSTAMICDSRLVPCRALLKLRAEFKRERAVSGRWPVGDTFAALPLSSEYS